MSNFDESWLVPTQFAVIVVLAVITFLSIIGACWLAKENSMLRAINDQLTQGGREFVQAVNRREEVVSRARYVALENERANLLETNRLQAAEIRNLEQDLKEAREKNEDIEDLK